MQLTDDWASLVIGLDPSQGIGGYWTLHRDDPPWESLVDLVQVCQRDPTVNVVFWSLDLRTSYLYVRNDILWRHQTSSVTGDYKGVDQVCHESHIKYGCANKEVESPTSVGVCPLGPLIECCYQIHGRGRILIRMINRLIDQVTEWLSHDSLIRDIWHNEIIDHTKHMSQQVNRYPNLFTTTLGGNDVLLDTSLCLWILMRL